MIDGLFHGRLWLPCKPCPPRLRRSCGSVDGGCRFIASHAIHRHCVPISWGYRPITIRKGMPIQINLSGRKPCPPRLRRSCGSVDGCRLITSHAIHSPCGLFHGRLSPYKMSKINALTSKLAERYFFHFAWLVT